MSFAGGARHVSRRAVVTTVLRATATATALVVAYYTVPFDGNLDGAGIVVLPLSLCAFCLFAAYEMRGIIRSDAPGMRAIQVLATVVPLFVVLFAATYYGMTKQNPAAFSTRLTRTDSLYFTVTVLSTVGFGDIVPVTETARVVVMTQMLGDLVLIGAGVRVLTGAVRIGLQRRQANAGNDPQQPPTITEAAQVDPAEWPTPPG
jgi:small-conductance mechanosensitive channel